MLNKVIISLFFISLMATPEFEGWKLTHDKFYSSSEEYQYRLAVYLDNVAEIEVHNRESKFSYRQGVNQFTDMTPVEFKEIYLSSKIEMPKDLDPSKRMDPKQNFTNAESIDWRETEFAVSSVKNQGYCGACWAFSTVAPLETIGGIADQKTYSFSPQQLVDCDTDSFNQGCAGGNPYYAYPWISEKGVASLTDYPYTYKTQTTGVAGTCKYNKGESIYGIDNGMYFVQACSPLETLLNKNTASVLVNADGWEKYKSGVWNDAAACSADINHGVTAVGYGTDDTEGDYWVIKNSWDTTWGESGFMRLQRNDGEVHGMCWICLGGFAPAEWHVGEGSSRLVAFVTFLVITLTTLLQ